MSSGCITNKNIQIKLNNCLNINKRLITLINSLLTNYI